MMMMIIMIMIMVMMSLMLTRLSDDDSMCLYNKTYSSTKEVIKGCAIGGSRSATPPKHLVCQ